MSACKPSPTPMDMAPKLAASDGSPVTDPTEYRSLAGPLQYLIFTRADIAYAIQQICLHMHDPCDQHLSFIKWVLWYVNGTLHHGMLMVLSIMAFVPPDRLLTRWLPTLT